MVFFGGRQMQMSCVVDTPSNLQEVISVYQHIHVDTMKISVCETIATFSALIFSWVCFT